MLFLISFIFTSLLFFGLDFLFDKNPSTFLFIDNFKTNLMFYILFLGFFFIVYSFIQSEKDQRQSSKQWKILETVDKMFNSKRNLMWSQFFSVSYIHHQDKVKEVINKGIRDNLFFGELKDNFNSRPFLDFISEKTIAKLHVTAYQNSINNYKFVEKRALVENKLDTYIFTSDQEKITLLLAPFNLLKRRNKKVYAIYDSKKLEDVITINKSDIVNVFHEDLTYNKDQITELCLGKDDKTIDDIKVISLTLKDNTVYEIIGSDISLEI